MSDTETCPSCGGEYKRLGTHWVQNADCDHPPLNETQKGAIRYLHEKHGLGHVRIKESWSNPNLQLSSRCKEVIVEVNQHLSWLAGPIKELDIHGERCWGFRTKNHPWFMRYVDNETIATMAEVVDSPEVVESTFDVSVDRWQKYGHDRVYINGLQGPPFIDVDNGKVVDPDGIGVVAEYEPPRVTLKGHNVYGEYEIVVDLRGNEDDVDE